MSKKRKSKNGEQGFGPAGSETEQGDELAGDLVDDDEAGVFAGGFACGDGGGGDADESGGARRRQGCPG